MEQIKFDYYSRHVQQVICFLIKLHMQSSVGKD